MDNKKVWFITGASKGFGLSLVKQLLDAGQLVAATSRNQQELVAAVGSNSADFLPLQVDLVNESSVSLALQHVYETFGRIDVVINNAGYGIGGAIEELTDAETRSAFDVNVFATLNVIRFVMPYLRKQRSGHIINIASIAGITGGTGWAVYAAAKSAVIGLSEVLALDVKSLGIKVTVVAPGAFRTSFLTADSLTVTQNPIAEYEDVRHSHCKYLSMNGQQAGDPEKAAASIINVVYEENPPLRLLLGGDAYNRALTKLDGLYKEIHEWENTTCATDF
ncbi:SDR family NAD(P)-dependent oxidoreductase [Mucilaginibacter sp. OK283]|jgi:NAD(P)-dependent dehydrogenase (short-subunit alcohol dehydrogenase family)|uniref:SDR family NAD(P)-dependent oxidoreductase n=1 Tax=Mucilaginibacter sp. OK283 TaxID=1881049 RepID=UPI0008BD88FF|nr:SDR family NAD(P)-dependent oxidoreductase [Mucilaginibacter sp. OK283]SEO18299.1 Short-chain dehydrogenase [Mucilaginibacter sp. OK283]